MSIPFGGQYDRSLIYRAVLLAQRASKQARILRLILFGCVAVGSALLLVGYFTQANRDPVKVLRPAISVLILLVFLLSPYVRALRVTQQFWKDPSAGGRVTGTVTALGLTYASPANSTSFTFKQVVGVGKASDLIVLLLADGTLSIHPRSFFASDEDWRQFQEWIELTVVEAK
jgi:hypothetical protein